MKKIVKLLASVLCLCLVSTAALAAPDLDGLLSFLPQEEELRFSARVELETLLPYGQTTLDQINALLRHISLEGQAQENASVLGVAVDGETLLSLSEGMENGVSVLSTNLLPNRTLTSQSNAMDALFPGEEEGASFDLSLAVDEAEAVYQELTDAIVPYAEEKKANYKIKNVGYAKWVRLAKLTAEEGEALAPQIVAVLSCGMDDAFREELSALKPKNGFTVALYRSGEEGEDLAVYMKGNVSMGEDDSRSLAYQWAFSRDGDGMGVDTYRLELTRSRGTANKRALEASRTLTAGKGGWELTVKSTMECKLGKNTSTRTGQIGLKGDEGSLAGTMSFTVKTKEGQEDAVTVSGEYAPELQWENGVLTGKVSVTEKEGKRTRTALSLTLGDSGAELPAQAPQTETDEPAVTISIEGGSVQQNADVIQTMTQGATVPYLVGQAPAGVAIYDAPSSPVVVDLDAADETVLSALQGELFQRAAGTLLPALAALPEEDSALLRDLISQEDYQAFLNQLGL